MRIFCKAENEDNWSLYVAESIEVAVQDHADYIRDEEDLIDGECYDVEASVGESVEKWRVEVVTSSVVRRLP